LNYGSKPKQNLSLERETLMANDDISSMEDTRSSVLDAFARSEPREQNISNLPVANRPLPERVIGAQHVAVARDEKRIIDRVKVLAAAAGSDWYYRFPVKTKGGTTDYIEGPSIKLANDLARIYGNCDIETFVTDLGDSWLIYARFTDYESGFSMTRPFQQRKSQRGMRASDDRALDIAFQIGASKAIRNVVINSLQTFSDFAFQEARNALVDKIGKNLEAYRERTLEGLSNKEIEVARVERVIGRAVKDWIAADIARVIAMMRSIADGMTTINETFPPLEASSAAPDTAARSEGGAQEPATPSASNEAKTPAARSSSSTPASVIPAAADDSINQAYERGKEAKAAGARRTALPGEYRDAKHDAEAEAWLAGYDGNPKPAKGELL
jgi:hypothetical protein